MVNITVRKVNLKTLIPERENVKELRINRVDLCNVLKTGSLLGNLYVWQMLLNFVAGIEKIRGRFLSVALERLSLHMDTFGNMLNGNETKERIK